MKRKRQSSEQLNHTQAQIMHRIAAGMNSISAIAIELRISLTHMTHYLRTIEARGDIRRVKHAGVPEFDLQFVGDSTGLMQAFPLEGYSSCHQVMSRGRLVALLDRPDNWNPVPLRPAPRTFVSCEQAWR